MKQTLPWNVTGIPPEARDVARAAASREGLSVGDWLTRRILADTARSAVGAEGAGPVYRYERDEETKREREELAIRLSRSEAETDSAFRRIDEALRALSRRLESNERIQSEAQRAISAAASEINAATHDQAEAFAHLTQRLDRVEQTSETEGLREAVRGLHQGLSRAAEQIARLATETANQFAALTGSLETAAGKVADQQDQSARLEQSIEQRFNALSERVRQIEERGQSDPRLDESLGLLETRMSAADDRLQQALAQQLAAIERNFAGIVTKLDHTERTRNDVQSQVRENLKALSHRLEILEKRSAGAADARPQTGPMTVPALEVEDGTAKVDLDDVEVPDVIEAAPAAKPASIRTTAEDYLVQIRRAAAAGTADPLESRGPLAKHALNTRTLVQVLLVFLVMCVSFVLMRSFGPRIDSAAPSVKPVSLEAASGLATLPPTADIGQGASSVLPQLKARADAGDAKSELLLGLRYADGDGVAANQLEAARWFQQAAQAGEAIAQYRLGLMYEKGRGFPADAKRAITWYGEAAKRGNQRAMHNLAIAYANGSGTEKNFSEAARWFRSAADRGFADSQFNLAVLYERGLGVRTSLVDAYKWYSIAAAQGDAESKSRVGALATQLAAADRDAADVAAKGFKLIPSDRDANEPPELEQVLR